MVALLTICSSCYSQKEPQFNSSEEKCIKVFKDFNNYIKSNKTNDFDIIGDSSLNYILLNYLFIDRKIDSSGKNNWAKNVFKEGEFEIFKRQLLDYVRYFQENSDSDFIDNIEIKPLRVSKDTFIYNQMTKFQKENTYAVFDKRNPDKTLFYVLFFPAIKDYSSEPRIWSWNLGYQYGKIIFTSPNGEVGYEHIFP